MNKLGKTSRPVLTFSILSSLFALSMFFRTSNAVIAPNLVSDLGLTAESLGMLGGAYFFCFALLQIPTGPILDTIGPRLVITSGAFIGALGGFLFAAGQSFGTVLAEKSPAWAWPPCSRGL
jgi:fucose permease